MIDWMVIIRMKKVVLAADDKRLNSIKNFFFFLSFHKKCFCSTRMYSKFCWFRNSRKRDWKETENVKGKSWTTKKLYCKSGIEKQNLTL